MRTLIPFIGVLFLAASSVKNVNLQTEIPSAEKEHDGKARVLEWMAGQSSIPAERLEQIYDEVHRYGHPELLIAIAKVESGFDPDAVSNAGAAGIMQVMAHVWKDELRRAGVIEHEDDLFDIPKCIAAGAYILDKYLHLEEGNLGKALKRYVGSSETSYHKRVIKTLDG